MPAQEIELQLSIPEQTLSSLSFSEHTPSGIKKWVKDLPLANVGEISRQLYQAIIELNKLAISPVVKHEFASMVDTYMERIQEALS